MIVKRNSKAFLMREYKEKLGSGGMLKGIDGTKARGDSVLIQA